MDEASLAFMIRAASPVAPRFPLACRGAHTWRMRIPGIEELAAHANKVAAEARSTGPKTEAGRARSAINAVKHGLAGRGLVLPGEDRGEYEAKLDGIFTALAPQDDAEAELVALVADDIWKLGRLARIEKGITLGRIEEVLALTGTAEKAGGIVNAITAIGGALTAWVAEPIPSEKGPEFLRRFRAMADALDLVEATVSSAPAELMEAGHELLAQLHGTAADKAVSTELYRAVFDHGRRVMTLLLDNGRTEDAAQDELRASISGIALPDEAELKKLARYRKLLEESLQRRLAALEQLRGLKSEKKADSTDVERAREYRVRLRVVA
jgi:hypothetical protein